MIYSIKSETILGTRRFRPFFSLILLLSWALTVRAEDWPQFRGPNRDGVWHETGLLESFPAGGLPVLWRTPVGPGWSSPVVADGRVFLTDVQLEKPVARERIRCFEDWMRLFRTARPLSSARVARGS